MTRRPLLALLVALAFAACGPDQSRPASPAAQASTAEPEPAPPAEPAPPNPAEPAAPAEPTTAPVAAGGKPRSREQIRAAIASRRAQVKICYERELTKNPKLAGKVVVKFVIAADGTVASAERTEEGVGPLVADCVTEVIKKLRFDVEEGSGATTVSYPFVFRPSGS